MSRLKVASNLFLRLSDRHVGPMNTQVRLMNSLVRLARWPSEVTVNSLVQCVTRNS